MPEIAREKTVSLSRLLPPLIVLAVIAVVVNLWFARRGKTDPHIEQGIAALNAHRYETAESEWRQALKNSPSSPEPYLLLSEYYVTAGRPEEALSLLQGLEKIAPTTKQLYRRLAESYSLTGQSDRALEAAKKAVQQDPADPMAHALLGIQLGNKMDTRESVSELTKATLLAPKDDKIALSLAQAQLDAGDFPAAEATARQVIGRNDRYATAYYLLGWSYSRREPTPEVLTQAVQAFQKATELDPQRADAFAELGRLALLKNDAPLARTSLEKAWKLGLRDAETAFNLASAYRKSGDVKQADQMSQEFKKISDYASRSAALEKTLVTSPGNLNAALDLADLQVDAGKYQEALPLLQKILAIQGRNLRALRITQKLYARAGDAQNAKLYNSKIEAVAAH